MLLVAGLWYLLGLRAERGARREVREIARRLAAEAPLPPQETPASASRRSTRLYRLVARAQLKIGALQARRRHGDVDLGDRRDAAVRAVRDLAGVARELHESPPSVSRPEGLDRLILQSEAVTDEVSAPQPGDAAEALAWERLAETLEDLRRRLKGEFRAAGAAPMEDEAGEDLAAESDRDPGGPGESRAAR